MNDNDFLKHRINEVATENCEDYPNIETCDSIEQFYAISSALQGTNLACKDWSILVKKLQKIYNIEQEEIQQLWKEIYKEEYNEKI